MSITAEKKREIIENYGHTPEDAGSTEVQIAILTERINNLSQHFKTFPKDNNSKRGFFVLIGRRKKLLAYLRRKDYKRFKSLTQELGIRVR